jgi:hypothetical protein
VEAFVDMAIEFKFAMTEEQAIYRCYLVAIGEAVKHDIFELDVDGEASGIAYFCTFPGLRRRHLSKEGHDETVIVVKARGELQDIKSNHGSQPNQTDSASQTHQAEHKAHNEGNEVKQVTDGGDATRDKPITTT